jgi:hypothetical protein
MNTTNNDVQLESVRNTTVNNYHLLSVTHTGYIDQLQKSTSSMKTKTEMAVLYIDNIRPSSQ